MTLERTQTLESEWIVFNFSDRRGFSIWESILENNSPFIIIQTIYMCVYIHVFKSHSKLQEKSQALDSKD